MGKRTWRALALATALATGAIATPGIGAEPAGFTFRHSLRLSGLADTTPNAFFIPDLTDQPVSSVVRSPTVAPAGFDAPAPIAVSGAGSPTLSIDGGPDVVAGVLSPGQSFSVAVTTPSSYGTASAAFVTVGGVPASWTVTTQAVSTTPDPFTIPSPTPNPVDPNTRIVSPDVTPIGYGVVLPISAADGAQISVAGGAWSTAATIAPAQSFRVALTSGGQGSSQTVRITVGPRTVAWTVNVVACTPGSSLNTSPGSGTFSMPRGCGTLDVDMCGGGGAATGSSNGGGAAHARSRFTIAGGSSLPYTVAGGGQPTGQGGIGGGGSSESGSISGPGGGGGGASWLYDASGNPLMVAAGGGGSHSINWLAQGCCSEQYAGAGGLPGSGTTTGDLGIAVANGGTSTGGGAQVCGGRGTYGQPRAGGMGTTTAGSGYHAGGGGGGGSIGQSVQSGWRYTAAASCGGYGAGARLNSRNAGGNGFIRFSWAP